MHADKSEPEFIFYDVTKSTVNIYRYFNCSIGRFKSLSHVKFHRFMHFSVKPAIFDLVLTCIIAAYLTVVYYAIQVNEEE